MEHLDYLIHPSLTEYHRREERTEELKDGKGCGKRLSLGHGVAGTSVHEYTAAVGTCSRATQD